MVGSFRFTKENQAKNGPLDLSAPRILGVLGHPLRLIYTFLCGSTLRSRVRETTPVIYCQNSQQQKIEARL